VDDRVWPRAVADRAQGRAGGDRVQGRAVVGAAAGGAAGVVAEAAGANAVPTSDEILNARAVEASTLLRSHLQADHDYCKMILNSE